MLLIVISRLTRFFIGLICFFVTCKLTEDNAFVVVGISIVWVEAGGLLIGGERFLVVLEIIKSNAFVFVGTGIIGVEADGLLYG